MTTTVPSGTITFLFTDVEDSTRLWAEERAAMSASLTVHDRIVCQVIDSWGGYVFTTAGDGFGVAFDRATRGVNAADRLQARLGDADWGDGPSLRVRVGLHVGEAEECGGGYAGPAVDTAAAIEAAGHGGQVLASEATITAAGVDGRDLGEHRLPDVAEAVRLFQLGDGAFPPPRVTRATPPPTPPAESSELTRSRRRPSSWR